jgi:peptidoglycan/LPS O-acetylase OafA/YrhL
LAYEFWYYLLFPLIVLAVRHVTTRRRAAALIGIALLCLAAGPDALSVFPAWLVGVGAFRLSESSAFQSRIKALPAPGYVQTAAGLSTVATMVAMQVAHAPAPVAALADALAAATFILASTEEVAVRRARLLVVEFGHRTAQFSYTLYAVHLPIALFLVAALDLTPQNALGVANVGQFAALVVSVVAIAYCLAFVTERQTPTVRAFGFRLVGALTDRYRDRTQDERTGKTDVGEHSPPATVGGTG